MSPDHTVIRAACPRRLCGMLRCGVVAVTLCVLAIPAHAGQAPAPPALVLTARAFGVIDKDSGAAAAPSSGAHAELSYRRAGRRVSLDLQGSTEARQRAAAGGIRADTQWIAAGIRVRISERTTVSAVQRLVYAPLYVPGAPGESPASAADAAAPSTQGIAGLASITMASGASVSRQMSRRTSATASYGFDRVSFLDRDSAATSHRASVAIERTLRRNVSLRVRYGYVGVTNAVDGGAAFGETQDLEMAAAYSPRASRMTTITVGLLPTLTARQDPASQAAPAPARLRSLAVGSRVGVDHRFGRTWRTGVAFQRTIYYLQGSNQPILADAVSLRAQGNLGRRVMMTMVAAASGGTPTLQQTPARVTSANVSARVDAIATRTSSVYAEYRYEAYASSGDIARLPGIAPRFSRSSVRLGVAIGLGLSAGRLGGQPDR